MRCRLKLMTVVMIRASNFPVLMLISLYERRQYSDTSFMEMLGDYAEHYLGTLPRKLKTASELTRSWVDRWLMVSGIRQLRLAARF
jgi:hypothetical protein